MGEVKLFKAGQGYTTINGDVDGVATPMFTQGFSLGYFHIWFKYIDSDGTVHNVTTSDKNTSIQSEYDIRKFIEDYLHRNG